MALKLENEFVVAAPIESTWRTLLDLERVAGCLPGARIEPAEEPGSYNGAMRVKLGPMTMFGRGIMQDVATSMLGDFAKCLSELMTANEPKPAEHPLESEALSVGGLVGRALFGRVKALFSRLLGRR